jgi:methylated-DNA-[protein]-cysteine S-methyltransferase
MLTIHRHVFDTPVGPMMALASERALCALEFWKPGRMTRLDARLRRWYAPYQIVDQANAVIHQTGEWIARYFAGERVDDPPLDMRGAEFERRVWAALRTIPAGATVSYGEIARRIGAPSASRAVGMANGANPIAIIVPCHRVIGANGTLTGYGGGLDRKAWLLAHEGVQSPRSRARNQPGQRETNAAAGMLPLDG